VNILIKRSGLLSPRAFLSEQKTLNILDFIRVKNRLLASEPTPQRRIGVGYRDKGTAAILHLDATPSWKVISGNLRIESSPEERFKTKVESATPFRILAPKLAADI